MVTFSMYMVATTAMVMIFQTTLASPAVPDHNKRAIYDMGGDYSESSFITSASAYNVYSALDSVPSASVKTVLRARRGATISVVASAAHSASLLARNSAPSHARSGDIIPQDSPVVNADDIVDIILSRVVGSDILSVISDFRDSISEIIVASILNQISPRPTPLPIDVPIVGSLPTGVPFSSISLSTEASSSNSLSTEAPSSASLPTGALSSVSLPVSKPSISLSF